MPRLSDSMTEATIVGWLKRPGEAFLRGDALVEVETDKATVVYEAESDGVLAEILVGEGGLATLGAPIARLVGAAGDEAPTAAFEAPAEAVPIALARTRARATPVARRTAVSLGVSLAELSGTGPGGRIRRLDVVGARPSAPAPAAAAATLDLKGPTTVVPLTTTGETIARRMTESRSGIPSFDVVVQVDMSTIVQLRRGASDLVERLPSVNDFVIRAAALALRAYPAFNSSFVDGRSERHGRVNVGIAVATDDALFVPAIVDTDQKSLAVVATEARELVAKAQGKRLSPDELTASTFTVSNLGMFGVRSFTAVINPPQVAILAVGSVARSPVETADGGVALPRRRRADPDGRPSRDLRRGRRALPRAPALAARAPPRPRSLTIESRSPLHMSTTIDFRTAVREALDEELAADDRVIFFGEDVALAGGVFAVTPGLYEKYGRERVFDTPISELALAGAAFGAAVSGLRPVIEIMFGDFLTLAMDSLVNQSTKYWFLSGEQVSVPLVIRSVVGAGGRFGAIHSQMPASWFMGVPGLKIVTPATPADAKGLLRSAIQDDNPVLFFEHKRLYGMTGDVDGELVPIGVARIAREGTDITIVSAMNGVHESLKAADLLAADGISCEVIDLRTLRPLDIPCVLASVVKTSRIVVVEEGPRTGGWAGEVLARVTEEGLGDLDDAWRIATADGPVPYSPPLEDAFLPGAERIAAEIRARVR